MSHITSKDYITITPTTVTVGGQKTTKFLGQEIELVETLPLDFKKIQDKVIQECGIQPIEMHVLSSKTNGHQGVFGNPSFKHGKHAWSRFVFEHDINSRWLFQVSHDSTSLCAAGGACYCIEEIRLGRGLRKTLVCSVAPKILKIQDSDILRRVYLEHWRDYLWFERCYERR